MTYLKAIIATLGAVATALGAAASTGHLNLASILIAIGGALAGGGAVATASNKTPAA